MKLRRVTIDTNPDICNLNCIMCDTHSIYNGNFKASRKATSKELLEKILDEVLKFDLEEIIPSTMGEPLLYREFNTFIDKLSGSRTKLNLTTNGTFPNGVDRWAERLLPILSDIKISINSVNPDVNQKIMVGDDTKKKIESIKRFIALRDKINRNVTVTLQVTFLKSNLQHLEEIIKFAIDIGADRVKGHQLWVNWREMEVESLQQSESSIRGWNSFVEQIDRYRDRV